MDPPQHGQEQDVGAWGPSMSAGGGEGAHKEVESQNFRSPAPAATPIPFIHLVNH